jgi:hypothetical protein
VSSISRGIFLNSQAEINQEIINVLTFWVPQSSPCLVSAEEFFVRRTYDRGLRVTHCGVNFLGTQSSLVPNIG